MFSAVQLVSERCVEGSHSVTDDRSEQGVLLISMRSAFGSRTSSSAQMSQAGSSSAINSAMMYFLGHHC